MASEACCKRSPVSVDYTPKGRYETIAGLNTYVTGSEDASKGIIDVFDVFGFSNQGLQGADIIAEKTGAVVLVPDYFHGQTLAEGVIPPDTEEKKKQLMDFFAGPANPEAAVKATLALRKAVQTRFPAAEEHWGIFGVCWGGKVAVLASGNDNEGAGRRFNVSGATHPGMLSADDARALTTPHILLASPEEPAETVAEIKEIVGTNGEVETYPNMFHGWMGARAKLDDEENAKEYARGYDQASRFFSKYL